MKLPIAQLLAALLFLGFSSILCQATEGQVATRSGQLSSVTVQLMYTIPDRIETDKFIIMPGIACFDRQTGLMLSNECKPLDTNTRINIQIKEGIYP